MSSAFASICILDDDTSVLRSIESLLESDGLAAATFEHPDAFLAHARDHEVKVAVLDVCLGEASGLDVQAKLHEISPGTRVIVMTGRDRPGVQTTAMQNGARAFLLKPFRDETFLAHVHGALAIAS